MSSNLKALKNRISSINKTKKITNAMKMVAASKMNKAQINIQQSKSYTQVIADMLKKISNNLIDSDDLPDTILNFLDHTKESKNYLIYVISSDKGLCGSLNATIIRQSLNSIKELLAQNKQVKIICVGKKAIHSIKKYYPKLIISQHNSYNHAQESYQNTEADSKKIIDLYYEGKLDKVIVFYHKFKNAITQLPQQKQIFPLNFNVDSNLDSKQQNNSNTKDSNTFQSDSSNEYEPDIKSVLEYLIPQYCTTQIYHTLLENYASEQGARMSAMDNAVKNCNKLHDQLTLEYNRSRQSKITEELIEIISGFNSL